MTILIILLFLFGFKSNLQQEEGAMLIDFGNTATGSGKVEPPKKATPPPPTRPIPPPPPRESSAAVSEDINTQDFEEAAAIEAAKKKEKERQKQEKEKRQREIEQQREIERQKELEAERLRQEELERIEKERREREAQAEAIRRQTGNAFGNSSNNAQSQGNSSGSGNQGHEQGGEGSGKGLGKGGSWSLDGRSMVGTLPKPDYKVQKEGIVVVEITVDRNGKVIGATPILRGSNTQDAQLWKLAQEAAMRARFNASPDAQVKQVGTITYNFVLN